MAIDDELERMRAARIPRPKPEKKPMRRVSEKMKAKNEAEKKLVSSDGDTLMEQWHKARRKDCVGVCQCGCGEPSQKKDNVYFRHSNAHIFSKHLFPSIMYHPLNFVERRFWAGAAGSSACHSIMDDTTMKRWPNMADWEDIKAKFRILVPLLTTEEKATNFYSILEKLVYEN
jgi:hypothetical protein